MHSNQTFKFLRSINNKQSNEIEPRTKEVSKAVNKEIERRRKKRIPKES